MDVVSHDVEQPLRARNPFEREGCPPAELIDVYIRRPEVIVETRCRERYHAGDEALVTAPCVGHVRLDLESHPFDRGRLALLVEFVESFGEGFADLEVKARADGIGVQFFDNLLEHPEGQVLRFIQRGLTHGLHPSRVRPRVFANGCHLDSQPHVSLVVNVQLAIEKAVEKNKQGTLQ